MGPVYVTAATLAAFAVSGLNVPQAIGDVRAAASSGPAATTPQPTGTVAPQRTQISATQLRDTLAAQQDQRASRLRTARFAAVKAAQKAVKEAEAAAEARRPKWLVPVANFRLTAGFGDWGLWSGSHTGQDFAAPYGSPVHAIGDGNIVSAGYDGAYGNKMVIVHDDGTVSWYAHMSAFERTSGSVKAGDVIGRVGSTGNSTGNHLHLEIRPGDGDPVEPLTWLRRHGVRV